MPPPTPPMRPPTPPAERPADATPGQPSADPRDPERVLARARLWIEGDPDPETRAELERLVERGELDPLAERVAGSLRFGTAGLRGEVGAGPLRMNRAVVIRTTRGLADHLEAEGRRDRPVVVGFDARVDSRRFATDTVGVLLAAGLDVRVFTEPVPTPLVAYAARVLAAGAAVVVTASHNPPRDNGYKVYGADAVQIVPPEDGAIAAAIAAVGPANEVPRDPVALAELPPERRLGEDLLARYLDELRRERAHRRPPRDTTPTIAYTPLHGVGWATVRQALADAGHHDVAVVPTQAEPDGTFPTVPFPNPEEPGALDRLLALATDVDAELAIANDPDVDRLAVAIPTADGWRRLHGNEIGLLLVDDLLANGDHERPLVVSSIVSTPAIDLLAAAHGARSERTLTGFKWICTAARALAGDHRFVLGFEEALGTTVGEVVRDKDGIGAAVAFADLAARARAEGRSVLERLDELWRRLGVWVSHQESVVRPGLQGRAEIATAMARLGAERPSELAGRPVTAATDLRDGADGRPRWLPADDVVLLALGDSGRVVVRPSGTEPKLKVYVDLRVEVDPGATTAELRAAERRASEAADELAAATVSWLGLGGR